MRKLACAAILLAAACSTGGGASSAPATTPTSSDAQQLSELRTSMTELLERLDVLNDRINRLEQGQEQQNVGRKAPSADVLMTPSSAAVQPVVTQPAPQPAVAQSTAVVSAQIATAYRDAIVMFGRNRMADARTAFQKVFDADPRGDLADNALFWIGETYFSAGQYTEAMRFYERVAKEYSDQNKAPDALYKLALAYEKTSDLQLAKKALEDVISRYPYSTPAASAKAELKRIKY
jgi:tol-pal system protein YbgF